MRAYVITTGVVFGLVTIAHIARMVVEHMGGEPWYLAITAATAALCVWAFVVARRPAR